ncbi:MAG: phosphotransferase [Deltaproteobacteria bacterium]|jgi:phosphate uptake regulator|nr:phosphotransferase [Deltaproteobacteria bacterium]
MITEIKGGFKILAHEVLQAAIEARDILRVRDPSKSRVLYHRSAYINTQVALLQNQIMDLFLRKESGYRDNLYLQGLSSIASRLERISDILLNLDRQAGYLTDKDFLQRFKLEEFFSEILNGLGKIYPAMERRDVSMAIRLGHVEERLDAYYSDRFAKINAYLKEGTGNTGDLVTSLMIIHYLERVGDMILEIGEKIIYVIMGEKIKLEQYKAVGAGLKATGQHLELGRMGFKSIWGGRSGCRIGVVGSAQKDLTTESPAETVLFKHGPAFKLTCEKENLQLWTSLRPGLTPEVKAFIPARAGSEAALMLEYIPSRNLQALFLENAPDEAFNGLAIAVQTMGDIWKETKKTKNSSAEFVRQAENRFSEAQTIYPQLIKFYGSIGPMEIEPFPRLLGALKEVEAKVPSNYSMLIHGDLNLSNILYNPQTKEIYMVDLYRSRENDYVQDVSVLLVSILRLPILDPKVRRRLIYAANMVHDFARKFSHQLEDHTFEARLAFGLARSFFTSTRFIMEEKMAAIFVARARYIWEKLFLFHDRGRPMEEFRLSKEILNLKFH